MLYIALVHLEQKPLASIWVVSRFDVTHDAQRSEATYRSCYDMTRHGDLERQDLSDQPP